MQRQRHYNLLGVLLALGLIRLPAGAQIELPDLPQPPSPAAEVPAPRDVASDLPGQPVLPPGGDVDAPQPRVSDPFRPYALMPPLPELAQKTREILALRQMLALHITAQDISVALPALRELRDAEKALEREASKILEDEKRALLAAQPDDPQPQAGEDRLRQAMERYRQQQDRIWQSLERSIGRAKAEGLLRLNGLSGPESGRFGPGIYGGAASGGTSSDRFRVGGPGVGYGGVDRGQGRSGYGTPSGGTRPGGPPRGTSDEADPTLRPPGQAPDRLPDEAPTPRPSTRSPLQAPDRLPSDAPVPSQPGYPSGGRRTVGPAARANRVQTPYAPSSPEVPTVAAPAFQPHLSLSELVDLLEQKQAAMRRAP